jgi:hypothetical protein
MKGPEMATHLSKVGEISVRADFTWDSAAGHYVLCLTMPVKGEYNVLDTEVSKTVKEAALEAAVANIAKAAREQLKLSLTKTVKTNVVEAPEATTGS